MTVTFFGPRDTPWTVFPALERLVRDLIEKEGADYFLLGNQGTFDAMAREILVHLKYVKNSGGGAAQFQTLALQKKKRVINLAEKR